MDPITETRGVPISYFSLEIPTFIKEDLDPWVKEAGRFFMTGTETGLLDIVALTFNEEDLCWFHAKENLGTTAN